MTSWKVAIPLIVLLLLLPVSTAAAEETGEDEDGEEGDTIVNVELEPVVEAIQDLIDSIESFTGDKTLEEILLSILFKPFRTLAQQLLRFVTIILTTTPTVHPNPTVEDVHQDVLLVTYLLASPAFMTAGLLYMIGPVLGVSYRQVRQILPRIILALAFASVSLPLIQLGIEFTNALTTAFTPNDLAMTTTELIGVSTGVTLAILAKSVLLLAVVALFIVRDVYILFVAAISPLLALTWSIPKIKRYADTFIAGWIAALLMAPLDVLVLKFSLALMNGSGADLFQSVSNWVFGVASLVLLLIVPFQLWTASQSAVGMAYSFAGGLKNRLRKNSAPRNTGRTGTPSSGTRQNRAGRFRGGR